MGDMADLAVDQMFDEIDDDYGDRFIGHRRPWITGSTGDPCPRCGAHLVERDGKNGKFLGCQKFPKCKGSMSLSSRPKLEVMEAVVPVVNEPRRHWKVGDRMDDGAFSYVIGNMVLSENVDGTLELAFYDEKGERQGFMSLQLT